MQNAESYLLAASLLFLAYYAARRFNSEPITLDVQQRSIRLGKDRRSPRADILLHLVSQPPPLFTTTRDRYRRAMAQYVLGYLLVFLALIFGPTLLGPDLVKYASDTTGTPVPDLPAALGERMLFALFLLTGVVNAFPLIRDWDQRFIKTLRENALIPTEVKLTARQLLDCGLSSDAGKALGDLPKLPPFIDSQNPEYGTATPQTVDLSNRWNTVVYLWQKCVDLPHRTRRYRLFKARFQPEMTAIQNHIDEMATRIHSALLLSPQGSSIPPGVLSDLEEDVEHLYARVALFASLLVFSGDRNINDINDRFREIGFNKAPLPWPRLDLNAWILSLLIVFVLMVFITVGYELFLQFRQLSPPPERTMGVPGSFGTAFLWSFLGAALFGASFIMAILTHHSLRLGRYEQHILHEGVELSDKPHLVKDSAVVFAFCLVAAWILLFALEVLVGRTPGSDYLQTVKEACTKALPWSFLVATAGVFAIFHHIHSREELETKWLPRAFMHGGLLFLVGAFSAFAALAGKRPIVEFQLCNWCFVIYAAAVSFAIGFATPFAFRFADSIRLRGAAVSRASI